MRICKVRPGTGHAREVYKFLLPRKQINNRKEFVLMSGKENPWVLCNLLMCKNTSKRKLNNQVQKLKEKKYIKEEREEGIYV